MGDSKRQWAEPLLAQQRYAKALNDLNSAVVEFGRVVKGDHEAEQMFLKLRRSMYDWETEFEDRVLKPQKRAAARMGREPSRRGK